MDIYCIHNKSNFSIFLGILLMSKTLNTQNHCTIKPQVKAVGHICTWNMILLWAASLQRWQPGVGPASSVSSRKFGSINVQNNDVHYDIHSPQRPALNEWRWEILVVRTWVKICTESMAEDVTLASASLGYDMRFSWLGPTQSKSALTALRIQPIHTKLMRSNRWPTPG